MKKIFYSFLIFLISQMGFLKIICCGRAIFHTIKDVSVSTTTIFAASENALFSKTTDNQIKTTNTIDGLSGQTISSLYYSAVLIKHW
jgi:hypothetical protein